MPARRGRLDELIQAASVHEMACSWTAPTADGDGRMARRLTRLEARLPGKVHVNGVDHMSRFRDDTFSAGALMARKRVAALHCWPYWTGAAKLGGPLGPPYTKLTAGMAGLARSLGNAPAHPVWAQEFGACTLEMPERDLLRFPETSIEHGWRAR